MWKFQRNYYFIFLLDCGIIIDCIVREYNLITKYKTKSKITLFIYFYVWLPDFTQFEKIFQVLD